MKNPKLAITNIYGKNAKKLADFAFEFGFDGIDWSLSFDLSERDFLRKMDMLKGFEVRYHCPWPRIDIAYADQRAEQAMHLFRLMIGLISKAGGRYITVHIGLEQSSVKELDWKKAIENLSALVLYGAELGITICLENITTAWTNNPKRFKTLVERTGAGVTLDIGHVHASRGKKLLEDFFKLYVLSNKDRIFNAHIYHTEIPQQDHVAPESLEQIFDRLWLLKSVTRCDWWVIELLKPDEILQTKDFLTKFLCFYEQKS
ncbi:MAG: TIM barrel protein [Thermodesulfovibrionales bacterium]